MDRYGQDKGMARISSFWTVDQVTFRNGFDGVLVTAGILWILQMLLGKFHYSLLFFAGDEVIRQLTMWVT